MTIDNALAISVNELAEGLTHCFEGYIMPAHFAAPMVANMIRVDAIDLGSSLVARSDSEEIVGVVLVARRGRICRIAAMAVAMSARRKGVGRELMLRAIEDARARDEEEIVLEVIEQNPAAIELYKAVGFQIQHRLIGFEGVLQSDVGEQLTLLGSAPKATKRRGPVSSKLTDCSFSDVAAVIRRRGVLASSWSMSPATVEQLASPARAVRCSDIYAVIGVSGEDVVACRSLGFAKEPSQSAVRDWVSALAQSYPGKKLYLPAFFPEPEYRNAFEGSALSVGEISQFQMSLNLMS